MEETLRATEGVLTQIRMAPGAQFSMRINLKNYDPEFLVFHIEEAYARNPVKFRADSDGSYVTKIAESGDDPPAWTIIIPPTAVSDLDGTTMADIQTKGRTKYRIDCQQASDSVAIDFRLRGDIVWGPETGGDDD